MTNKYYFCVSSDFYRHRTYLKSIDYFASPVGRESLWTNWKGYTVDRLLTREKLWQVPNTLMVLVRIPQ